MNFNEDNDIYFRNKLLELGFFPRPGRTRLTGPTGSIYNSPTSYDSVLFISFAQANYSRIMAFQDYIEIPNNNEVFTIGNDEVDILQKGVYEITFCGQITGVDQNHGAIFYLTEKSGAVV